MTMRLITGFSDDRGPEISGPLLDLLSRNTMDTPLSSNLRANEESDDLYGITVPVCQLDVREEVNRKDVAVVDNDILQSLHGVLCLLEAGRMCSRKQGGVELILTGLTIGEVVVRTAHQMVRAVVLDPGALARARNATHDYHVLDLFHDIPGFYLFQITRRPRSSSRGSSCSPC